MRAILLMGLLGCTATKSESDSAAQNDDAGSETSDDSPVDDAGNGADADVDGPEDCEDDMGTFEGQILSDLPWGSGPEPEPHAHVLAVPSTGSAITIPSDEEGRFSTPLPAGEYLMTASSTGGCVSDQLSVTLDACETENHTMRLIDCLDGATDGDGSDADDTGSVVDDVIVDGGSDDDGTPPDDDADSDGAADDGATDDGAADDGATDDGATDDGAADDGATDDGAADDGATDDGATDDGSTDDGSTDDGSTDDGAADDGAADDGTAPVDADFVTTTCSPDHDAYFDTSAATLDGDVLVLSVGYGGCSDGHTFIPCWDGEWDRAMPPGATLQVGHDDGGEMCMMYVMEDIRIDISAIIADAEARTGTEPFNIYVEGHTVGYSF